MSPSWHAAIMPHRFKRYVISCISNTSIREMSGSRYDHFHRRKVKEVIFGMAICLPGSRLLHSAGQSNWTDSSMCFLHPCLLGRLDVGRVPHFLDGLDTVPIREGTWSCSLRCSSMSFKLHALLSCSRSRSRKGSQGVTHRRSVPQGARSLPCS